MYDPFKWADDADAETIAEYQAEWEEYYKQEKERSNELYKKIY